MKENRREFLKGIGGAAVVPFCNGETQASFLHGAGASALPTWRATADGWVQELYPPVSSYTFTNVNINATSPTNVVVVGTWIYSSGGAGSLVRCTVGGVNLTRAVIGGDPAGAYSCELWYKKLTTGATADIRVDFGSAALVEAAIGVGVLDNVAEAPQNGTSTVNLYGPMSDFPWTGTLSPPTNGFGIAWTVFRNSTTLAWTNMVNSPDGDLNDHSHLNSISIAHCINPTIPDYTGTQFHTAHGAGACWGP
jgi:hypothetical protein